MAGEFSVPVPDVRLNQDQGKFAWGEGGNNLLGVATQAAQLRNLQNENKLFTPRQHQLELQNRGLDIQNTTNQAALSAAYQDRFDTILAAAQDDRQALEAIGRAQASGVFGPDPAWVSAKMGSASITSLRQQALMAKGNAAELGAGVGTVGQINTGGQIKSVVTKVGPNGATVDNATGSASNLPTTMTPSEKVAGIATVDPVTHAPTRTSVGAAFTDTGEPRTPGPIVTGNAPGVAEAQAGAYGEQVKRAQAIADRAAEVPTRRAALENLRGSASEFASGPHAGFWTKVGQFAQEYGLPAPRASMDATAANEEFNKLAVGVMALQRQQMGLPSTDASTALTTGAVPSDHLSAKGIQRVTGLMEGNEDYIAAMNQARLKWQEAHHNNGETTNDFQSQFNKVFDPRVFQAQYMTPDQRARVREQVGPSTFDAQERAARRLGWLGQQGAEPVGPTGGLAGASAAGLVR